MMNTITTTERRPKSVLVDMASRFGMEPAAFEATLRATVVPEKTSREQFAAFLLVAKEYGLNPITKEIYAFPTKGGGIQPIVGIDGWMNLINSHPQCDGIEFNEHIDDKGALYAITCNLYRKDRGRPTAVTEYMAECKRPTEPWQKWPARMLRHKAAIQAARYAFGFAGIIDPDEAERSPEIVTNMANGAPKPPVPPPARLTHQTGETIDAETGEVTDSKKTAGKAGNKSDAGSLSAGAGQPGEHDPAGESPPEDDPPPPASGGGDEIDIAAARRDGAEARGRGLDRKALPANCRRDDNLMEAWLLGFDTGSPEREPGEEG